MAGEAHFEIYRRLADAEVDEGFGWRFRAANGQISAVGGEGFTRREDARRAIHDLIAGIHTASTESAVMKQGEIVGGAIVFDRMRPADTVPILDVEK